MSRLFCAIISKSFAYEEIIATVRGCYAIQEQAQIDSNIPSAPFVSKNVAQSSNLIIFSRHLEAFLKLFFFSPF